MVCRASACVSVFCVFCDYLKKNCRVSACVPVFCDYLNSFCRGSACASMFCVFCDYLIRFVGFLCMRPCSVTT